MRQAQSKLGDGICGQHTWLALHRVAGHSHEVHGVELWGKRLEDARHLFVRVCVLQLATELQQDEKRVQSVRASMTLKDSFITFHAIKRLQDTTTSPKRTEKFDEPFEL